MADYTKGEWKVQDGHIESNGKWICQLWSKKEEDFENSEANALLIAAAPDLYNALKGIKELAKGYTEMPKDIILKAIDKALAKAEGK
jgi:hypothetical protein